MKFVKFKTPVAYLLSFLVPMQPVLAAGIAPAGGNVNVGTPSGSDKIPVLNINAPTAAGVSHNKFNEFNVDEKGLIINNLNLQNYNPNYKSSLSGEHVEFNYNFGTGNAAKVILNEVVSNSTTALRGYTEIYGQKADYIVANPNGITCAGCGFINTGRLSLITGTANIVSGEVGSFNIGTGTLQIDGVGSANFGLYAPTSADLVSNAVRIAGEVYANGDLSIYSGNDKFDYKNKVVSSNNMPGVSVAVDSTAIGGMKANNIKIIATQNGFGINTAGNLVADMGNIEITADGDITIKTTVATNDVKVTSNAGTLHSNGGSLYAQNIDINAGAGFINNSKIESEKALTITSGGNFQNNSDILSNENMGLTIGSNFTNAGNIQSNIDLLADITGDFANNNKIYTKNNLTLNIGGNATTGDGSYTVANKNLNLTAIGDLKNIGKIQSGGNATYDVMNLNNYGQILSNKNLGFNVGNDLINYRASAILSGGNIDFKIARDLVNYKAEIYAIGDITIQGRDDIADAPSGLTITPGNMVDMAALYNNPYIAAEPPVTVVPPIIEPDPVDGFVLDDIQFKLANDTIIVLPADAFADDAVAGTVYVNGDGYVFIIGTETATLVNNPAYDDCMATAGDCSAIPQQITEYTYTGTDDITIHDAGGATLTYTIIPPTDDVTDIPEDNTPPVQGLDEIPVQPGSGYVDSALPNKQPIMDGYTFNNNLMGTLLNWAGRIESGGNMEINADQIMNKGFDINTGNARADIKKTVLRSKPTESAWRTMWYQTITKTNLDTVAGKIIAGGNMTLNGNDILNQSSILSSKGDMVLNATNSIKNQTYSELATVKKVEAQRVWQWRGFKSGYHHYYRTRTEQKRVYSKQRSTILSGGELRLKSTTLENDQVLDPLSGLGLNSPMPTDVKNTVSVDTKLPVGDNGLFKVTPDGKYLVQTNVSFINPNDFVGSDYFFDGLGGGYSSVDTTRIIGDPAYETRLIMDAIVKATGQHYLDNGAVIGSDTDQMRTLYDSALDVSQSMNLKVGIALTPDQIESLQKDIIWYVEKEIDGHKVLVPQLYLSQATLDSLDDSKASKITGVKVLAENDYMVNVGTISADSLLSIDTKTLLNESNDQYAQLKSGGALAIDADAVANRSASISGNTVSIKADTLTNETKKNVDNWSWHGGGSSGSEHIEQAAQTATISGKNGLDITVTGTLHNTGAILENKGGDVNIEAGNVIFDTLALYNNKTERNRKRMNLGMAKLETLDIKESLKNVGSEIRSGGDINITTTGDALFIGTKLDANGNDINLNIGGDYGIHSVVDYDYNYHYSKKERFALENVVGEIGSAIASAALVVAGAFVSGVSFGTASPLGVGAIAAGVSGIVASTDSASDRDNYRKSKTTIQTDYDETIVASSMNGNNININVGGDMSKSDATKMNYTGSLSENVAGTKTEYAELEEEHVHTKQTSKSGKSFGDSLGTGAFIGTVIGGAAVLNMQTTEADKEQARNEAERTKEQQKIYEKAYEDFIKINDKKLGGLSEWYETRGRGPGTVNMKTKTPSGNYVCPSRDAGGCSYGSWQIETKKGTMKEFLKFLSRNEQYAAYSEALTKAGGYNAALNGNAEFVAAWQALAEADPAGFKQAQYDYIYKFKYTPAMNHLAQYYPDFNLSAYSPVITDIIWSMSVQHGGVKTILDNAFLKNDLYNMTDLQIINALYDARADYMRVYRIDPSIITQRTVDERKDAIKLLTLK